MRKIFLLFIVSLLSISSFAKVGTGEMYNIVIVSEDESKGRVFGTSGLYTDESPIIKNAYPNRGYHFVGWTSAKGYSTEYVSGDDTLTAHFEPLNSYDIVFMTSDPDKGIVTEQKVVYYENELIKNNNLKCLPGWSFDRWENTKGIEQTIAERNDTLVAYFKKYTETKDVQIYINEYIYLYGNKMVNTMNYRQDSVLVTNKKTGEEKVHASRFRLDLEYGDTLIISNETLDGHKFDNPESELTITCDSVKYLSFTSSIITDSIALEEAEGDSFTVVIAHAPSPGYLSDTTSLRVKKGETIALNDYFHTRHVELDNGKLYEAEEFKVKVVNDVFLKIVIPETTSVKPIASDMVEREAIVNVYDRCGRLIKRNARRNEALDGLSKGLYFVGRKKVFKM